MVSLDDWMSSAVEVVLNGRGRHNDDVVGHVGARAGVGRRGSSGPLALFALDPEDLIHH